MRLTFVDESADLRAIVVEAVGVSSDDETIAELLRAEVTARGHCTRSVAVRRAVRALIPRRSRPRGRLRRLLAARAGW